MIDPKADAEYLLHALRLCENASQLRELEDNEAVRRMRQRLPQEFAEHLDAEFAAASEELGATVAALAKQAEEAATTGKVTLLLFPRNPQPEQKE
jgi:hypothetical protein